ncbi:MAG TPA: bifunctional hydroxymethylpyrimidine kinase/phosphomethylpyrimidine kinase [Candidatus Acidoferrum sp.]|nr:bifunctional hydroxymethylpyrimidine kinase/phosphomethylpyrimidine kinase [Candidatus Acidoferrum sp.]
MSSARLKPVALTIAGSDSGGGAGIQADLQTFAALGVHGASAITCITAQNPGAITRLEACAAKMVRAQIEAVFSYAPPAAAKTGLLYSAAIVREVARFFRRRRGVPLVVDPVMMATSGRRLLQRDALATLRRELLPLAALVTPNLAEAEALIGKSIRTPEELRAAARTICQTYGCAALVKGGHLAGGDKAVDFLCGAEGEWMVWTPRVKDAALHGGGCRYSAAITAWLARGESLREAVELGKTYIANVIVALRRGEAG